MSQSPESTKLIENIQKMDFVLLSFLHGYKLELYIS